MILIKKIILRHCDYHSNNPKRPNSIIQNPSKNANVTTRQAVLYVFGLAATIGTVAKSFGGGKDEAKEQAAKDAAAKKAQRRQEIKEQRFVK